MTSIKICPQCKTSFEGRKNKLYCSTSCKTQAFQVRHTVEGTNAIYLSADTG